MKQLFEFEHKDTWSTISISVDRSKFTKEHAQATLDFFLWDYDEEADPIDEVVKKYANEALRQATMAQLNTSGVINAFKEIEGFCPMDGSHGIKLLRVEPIEFDADSLELINIFNQSSE